MRIKDSNGKMATLDCHLYRSMKHLRIQTCPGLLHLSPSVRISPVDRIAPVLPIQHLLLLVLVAGREDLAIERRVGPAPSMEVSPASMKSTREIGYRR